MNHLLNDSVAALNSLGGRFCGHAGSMFIQAGVLIVALSILDLLLRKRIRATVRYWLWMLVFVKLLLPSTLSVPTGAGYWLGDYFRAEHAATARPSDVAPLKSAEVAAPPAIADAPYEPVAGALPDSAIATATSGAPAAPRLNVLTWQGGLFGLWILGVLAISALLVQRVFFVRVLIAQSEPAESQLVEVLTQCRRQLSLRQETGLRLSPNVTSPAVCGLSHPTILIPKAIAGLLSPEKLRAVVIHELAHIKRGDLWVNCVQTLVQVVYFYNPFVWLANVVVRRIREQAVDEMVLVALGVEAGSYSNTLIDLAEMASSRPALSLRLVGVVESKKALSARIRHIISRPIPKTARLGILGLLTIILAAAVLLPMAKAERQASVPPTESTPEHFVATLPNGVTVELMGVCEHPSKGKQWWRPDGKRSVYLDVNDGREHRGMSFTTGEDRITRHFAFELKNLPKPVYKIRTQHEITPCFDNGLEGPIMRNGVPLSDIWLIGGAISKGAEECDIRFAVCLGNTEYQWIKFKNVSLQPGVTTDVHVEVETSALQTQQTRVLPVGDYALAFDGVNDFLEIHASESLKLGREFTVQMWVKPEFPDTSTPDDSRNLLSKGGSILGHPDEKGNRMAHTYGFSLSLKPKGDSKVELDMSTANGGVYTSPIVLRRESGWMHLAIVSRRDGGGASRGIYYIQTGEVPYEPAPNSNIIVGRDSLAPQGNPFKGQIAGLRIWNRALDAAEVERYKTAALTGNEPNLVGCWTFEQGQGQRVRDLSRFKNDASLGSSYAAEDSDPVWVRIGAAKED